MPTQPVVLGHFFGLERTLRRLIGTVRAQETDIKPDAASAGPHLVPEFDVRNDFEDTASAAAIDATAARISTIRFETRRTPMPTASTVISRCPGGVGERHLPHAAWVVMPQGSSSGTELSTGFAAIDRSPAALRGPKSAGPRDRDGFSVIEA